MSITINGTTGISGVDGSSTTPAFQGTDTNTGLFYGTDIVGISTGGSERVRVDASGNVGIGTTSPDNKLEIALADNQGINLEQLGAGHTGYINWRDSDGTLSGRLSYDHGTDAMRFTTLSTERMRIDSSGRVQINDTATVSGLTAKLTITSATSTESNITLKDSGTTYGTGTQFISFANSSNTSTGSIQHTAVTTVAYATTSDARLKENITDAPSSLDKIVQAKVRSFDWKEDKKHVDYGFIAQELYEIYPDAVCRGEDSVEIENPKETWQVDYGRITPLLLKAIQEQQTIINDLKARVTALEASNV